MLKENFLLLLFAFFLNIVFISISYDKSRFLKLIYISNEKGKDLIYIPIIGGLTIFLTYIFQVPYLFNEFVNFFFQY